MALAPTETRRSVAERKKRIEEVVTYAWNHRTRVLILILLNEGVYTNGEVAEILDLPSTNVANHIREMAEAGSIELAKTEKRRNATLNYYRAIKMPLYTDEDMEKMTPEQRQVTYGLVMQSMVAEMMASLWSGKMQADPRTWMTWRWFNVDAQGREDIADEQHDSWDRMFEIEAESTNRRAETKEDAVSILVAIGGFPRARRAPKPPGSRDGE